MKKDKKWLQRSLKDMEGLISLSYVFELINQLEEPEQEKVIVPQFVADWIDSHKEDNLNLGDSLNTHYEDEREIHHWLYMEGSGNNDEIFARAWLDGYTIEKEKLYKVELPIDRLHHILTIHADGSGHFFGKEHINNYWYKTHLTEREIKAIDERFWAFAEEITK